jgi:predicted molibdopterin-dependent oxidoreductase YjgC
VRQALAPRGQSRPDWQIICDVAKRLESRLGRVPGAYWDYSHPREILAEMGRLVPEYAGITYDRIEQEGLQWPVPTPDHPGTPFLFADAFPRGRGRFHPLSYKASAEEPDEFYPFILTTGRVLYHWHGGTMTRHSHLEEAYPEALCEINPADAARIGCSDGQRVRVSSRRGTIALTARVTEKSPPGTVFIPFHFVEAAANLLTIEALDPLAKIPSYKVCAVRVETALGE